MGAFEDGRRDQFIARTVQTIESNYPIPFRRLGPDKLRALILRGIERGERLEIRNPVLLGSFIELTVAFGEKFERSQRGAWANEVLNDPSLPAAFKVRIIEEKLFSDSKGRPVIEDIS